MYVILCYHYNPDDVLNKLNGYVPMKTGSVWNPNMYFGTKLKLMQLHSGIWVWSMQLGLAKNKIQSTSVKVTDYQREFLDDAVESILHNTQFPRSKEVHICSKTAIILATSRLKGLGPGL